MNKKTALTIIKLIPVIAAVVSYILIMGPFSSPLVSKVISVTFLLAFMGFVFFFIGRKSSKEDKALKILGILDLLSTVSVIVLFALAVFSIAGPFDNIPEESENNYAAEDIAIGANIGTFTSVDLEGNEVTDAVFADKDVTVINVWATFCGPCIEEMPELAALAEELPDNAQVIGIVIDTPPADTDKGDAAEMWGGDPDNIDLAKQICGETGVKYTNILASGSVSETFNKVSAVPTTFIVDKSGNNVCKPFVGADVEGYKQAVEEYLAGL